MTIRLTCTQCQASFLVADERLGQLVSCPKCGSSSRMPETLDEVAQRSAPGSLSDGSAESVLVPTILGDDPEEPGPRRRGRLVPILIVALGVLIVAALILWPLLRWPDPEVVPETTAPIDPIERTARQFLDALVAEDAETVNRLSTLADPPAISSFDDAQRDPREDKTIRGSFAPIAALHREIASKYTYDPAIDRFQNANPLGVAADFMDEADRVRQENESSDIYSRIAGGSADEQLDAAVEFAEQFAKLTQFSLPRKELVPTYAQLVEDAEPPLPPEAEALALDVGERRTTWDALLGRPFHTIEADGPFVLDRAEVLATIRDRLASPGDPERRLRLELVRFRLDAIDTGWKVVAARREDLDPSADIYSSPGIEEGP